MSIIVDFQPVGKKTETEPGISVLQAAQIAGVGITAVCGGQASCGSCRVRLDSGAPVNPPSDSELSILSSDHLKQGFRLACKTIPQASIVVDIPPESLTAPQRTQVEGWEESIEPDPAIRFHDISFSVQQRDELTSKPEKSAKFIKQQIGPALELLPGSIARKIGNLLSQNRNSFRIISRDNRFLDVLAPGSPVPGIAIDIGTTKIAGYLLDLASGKTLAGKGIMNPQIAYGEDVMARITLLIEETDKAMVLQQKVVEAINQLADDLFSEVIKENAAFNALTSQNIVDYVAVGNTAMHHIFLGLPVKQLGLAPYLPAEVEAMDLPADQLGLKAAQGAQIHILPNVAGFVGADHISMLMAANINQDSDTVLYIDIGTNTEITLNHNQRMISCSAASGPAFEGAHIRHGMRAAEGAIEKIRIEGKKIIYQTIGNVKPVGICGSGILDGIAQMLDSGVINKRGTFNTPHPLVSAEKEVVLAEASDTAHQQSITINRKDVSEIQLAKGAIRAAIELLLKESGISFQEIKTVKLAGAFGNYIDINSARTVGIFPAIPAERFRQLGNAAGSGAKQALLSKAKRKEAQEIAAKIEYLELSTHPDFPAEFTKAISFDG